MERDKLRFSETFAIVGPELHKRHRVTYGVYAVEGHVNPTTRHLGLKRAKLDFA
jgi:hypothetical protein